MKKYPLLYIVILLIQYTITGQSQNWRSSVFKENSNFSEIVSAERASLKHLRSNTDKKSKKQIKQFERWANFWKDRVLPDGSFVSGAHTFNEWKKENEKSQALNGRTNINNRNINTPWSLVGPVTPPISNIDCYAGMGRVNTVAFSGNDTNTLYVGTPSGGVWKSTDGGNSWTPKGDELANLGVSDIVIDPTNPNTLYLATGDWDGYQNRSIGVLKSTDAGENWSTTGLTFSLMNNDIISKILINPNNTNTLFATTLKSIKRSTDGGDTWTDVLNDSYVMFNDIKYKKGSQNVIYASTRNGKFYVSTLNGLNWTKASKPTSGRLDFALTDADEDLIISLDQFGAVRKSTDQGSTWNILSNIPGFEAQYGYNMTIEISPIDKNLIIAGGVNGWRSTDGGVSWVKYLDGYWHNGKPFFYVHSDHHDMKFIPGTNTLFSANDGGLFKGDATINTPWIDLSSGLAISQYYNVSGTPQNSNYLIMGSQDSDVFHYNGTNWTSRNPSTDGVDALWDYSNSDVAWTCSQLGILKRTTNGFTTSQYVSTPSGAPFVWELEIHPTIPTTIYGGFSDVFKSTDRGDNWTNLNSGVGAIEFISIAPSNPNVIYVSGRRLVKKTIDDGANWSSIVLPQSGTVKSIEVNPTNPSEVYIAYSGYRAGKVYKSTDGGDNWINITGSLPNVPTHKIIYKTGSNDGELFLATDLGVYHWSNSIGDWRKFGTGLPNIIVTDIEIHYGTHMVRAATFGRGVWEIPMRESKALGIDNNELPENTLQLFPNPTINKTFTIKLNNLNENSKVMIYNIVGTVVKKFDVLDAKIEVDLNNFSSGMYFVKVFNDGKSSTKKLIVN